MVLNSVATLVLAIGSLFFDWSWASIWVICGLLLTVAGVVLLNAQDNRSSAKEPGSEN
jgi:hypothetical protein